MTEPRRQALVLSGGGVKGAYQAGAIREVLQREHGFEPRGIYGISVGSINGGILASIIGRQVRGAGAPDYPSAGEELERFWREHIIDHTAIASKRRLWGVILDILGHNFRGILDVEKSKAIIREKINKEDLRRAKEKLGLQFFAGTLNLTTAEFLNASSDHDDIIEYVIASAMAPIVMPMAVIRALSEPPKYGLPGFWDNLRKQRKLRKEADRKPEECWLDGGLCHVAPVSAAIDAGYDDVICVICRPDKMKPGEVDGHLGRIGGRISDVVAHTLLNDDIEWARQLQKFAKLIPPGADESKMVDKYRDVNIVVIRPAEELPYEPESLPPGAVREMAETGRSDARREMSRRSASGASSRP